MPVRTVLHVDDNTPLRAAIARALRKEPYQILGAADGIEALSLLRRQRVDVIVCDEAMPGMRGTELLAHLRQEFPDVVPILLTGYGSVEVTQRAVNHGAVYRILTKPCSPADLAAAIRQALEHKRLGEHAPGRAPRPGGQGAAPAGGHDDPYAEGSVIEVEDAPIDLQRLLAELESTMGETPLPPSATGHD